MDELTQFLQERHLDNNLSDKISPFWQQGQFSSFSGVDDVPIHYAVFTHNKTSDEQIACPGIVIVPGRCEGYLKYQELAFDLFHQGYNIFIIDHRGQGLSGRLLPNVNKGYVKEFQDYVTDLQFFIENIVTPHCSTAPYLLAHSMGGTIALRFMQDNPNAIKAAVISSPMLGFYTGKFPQAIAKELVCAKLKINNLLTNNPWYFLGQKDYVPKSFSQNRLTHSSNRYQLHLDLYEENKSIKLGGVTTHWLQQSLRAQKIIFEKLGQLITPTLILQAGDDTIVSNKAQNDLSRKLHAIHPQSFPHSEPVKIDGAYHELFFEVDLFRNKTITETLNYFDQHS